MDDTDTRLIALLEGGLPLVPEPFAALGERLGISGDVVIARVSRLRNEGLSGSSRARIDQRKLGIVANALVAWKPSGTDKNPFAGRLAAFLCVTHCYERQPVPGAGNILTTPSITGTAGRRFSMRLPE
jgi:DNA-binding Lrp family transcriptional regulator